VPYDARFTSYTGDGTPVEAHKAREGIGTSAYDELRRFDPAGTMDSAPMPVDLFEDTEAIVTAGTDAVLVMRDVATWSDPRRAGAWPGPTILDIDSGRPLAQIPIPNDNDMNGIVPLGWAGEDTVLLRCGDHVVAWNYRSGTLRRVTTVATTSVTLATALVEADN
jgi:hypothetical protein